MKNTSTYFPATIWKGQTVFWTFSTGEHTWKAPYRSDWAIAIGEFEGDED